MPPRLEWHDNVDWIFNSKPLKSAVIILTTIYDYFVNSYFNALIIPFVCFMTPSTIKGLKPENKDYANIKEIFRLWLSYSYKVGTKIGVKIGENRIIEYNIKNFHASSHICFDVGCLWQFKTQTLRRTN